MLKRIRLIFRISLVASLVSSAAFLYTPAKFAALYAFSRNDGEVDPAVVAQIRIHALGETDYQKAIDTALEAGDPELARSIVLLASDNDVEFGDDVKQSIEDQDAFHFTKMASEAWGGFAYGDSETPTAFVAAMAADMSVIGDVRDLYEGVSSYPDYDEFSVGLALVGIVSTGATISSGWSAMPARAGVTLLKSAKRAGKLSATLTNELKTMVSKSFDMEEARQAVQMARNMDTAGAVASAKKVLKPEALNMLGNTATSIGEVAGKQGYRGTLQTLSIANTTDDIRRLKRVSDKFGDRFRAVASFIGSAALLTMGIFEFLATFVWWIVGGVVWLIGVGVLVFEFLSKFIKWRWLQPAL